MGASPILEWAGVVLVNRILAVVGGGHDVDVGGLVHSGVVPGGKPLVGGSFKVLMPLLIVGLNSVLE
jgi:hypothetical protein